MLKDSGGANAYCELSLNAKCMKIVWKAPVAIIPNIGHIMWKKTKWDG